VNVLAQQENEFNSSDPNRKEFERSHYFSIRSPVSGRTRFWNGGGCGLLTKTTAKENQDLARFINRTPAVH